MDAQRLQAFRRVLLQQRQALLRTISHTAADLSSVAERRDSEMEGQAQDQRAARLLEQLDQREQLELQAIERALARIEAQRYGVCEGCGGPIPQRRLAALPATPHCHACAEGVERDGLGYASAPTAASRAAAGASDPLPGWEVEEMIRQRLLEDGRVDLDGLRISHRRGVVYLDGFVSSEAERRAVLHTVGETMGLADVVDRLQLNAEETAAPPQPWESSGSEAAPPTESDSDED